MTLPLIPLSASPSELALSREGLLDGSFVAALRASAPAGMRLRSNEELEASLDATLAQCAPGADIHVFGYGSLMWNPAFHHVEACKAKIRGWQRSFCLWLRVGRGSPALPALMLALDRGGSCEGMAFRIPAELARDELMLLWRREMLSGAYEARWIAAHIEGRRERVLSFVANRSHERYVTALRPDEIAHYIATGVGKLGTCKAYFVSMMEILDQMQVRDPRMDRIGAALSALRAASA